MPRGGAGRLDAESETLIPTIGGGFDVAHALTGEGFDASEDGTGQGTPLVPVAFDWQSGGDSRGLDPKDTAQLQRCQVPAIAFNMHKSGNRASSLGISDDKTDCLRAFDKSPFAVLPVATMQVRRLTPRECERLQGFPDDYTSVPHRGKPAADGPRYKALGNSWAVPVARWIGQRMDQVEAGGR